MINQAQSKAGGSGRSKNRKKSTSSLEAGKDLIKSLGGCYKGKGSLVEALKRGREELSFFDRRQAGRDKVSSASKAV